jgi:arginase
LERRQFLIQTAAAAVGSQLSRGEPLAGETPNPSAPFPAERAYYILGVPLRTGSLTPGSENDAQAYRNAQFLSRLQAAGCRAFDDGDVAIPSYIPHHSLPPIRSWPGPRVAWDCVGERVVSHLRQPGHVPLLIGCDCSVVVGTSQALKNSSAEGIHVLYIDGDFDDSPPDAKRSQSAASCAVWLLTHDSPFWAGPPLRPSEVTVVGWSNPSLSGQSRANSVSLSDVRRLGPKEAARQVLAAIPPSASVVLHFDIDAMNKRDMPVAYFPHDEGMTLSECGDLLAALLRDSRIRIIEVSEYASLRDLDGHYVSELIDMITAGLKS